MGVQQGCVVIPDRSIETRDSTQGRGGSHQSLGAVTVVCGIIMRRGVRGGGSSCIMHMRTCVYALLYLYLLLLLAGAGGRSTSHRRIMTIHGVFFASGITAPKHTHSTAISTSTCPS